VEFLGANPEVEGQVRAQVAERLALAGAPRHARPAGQADASDENDATDDQDGEA